jgi:adenylate kinase
MLFWMLTAAAYAAGPVVVLIGPPGAGKSTQADILKEDTGMALISVDALVEQNRAAFEKYRRPSIQGVEPRLDPAMNKLVENQIRSTDLSKGLILDGYPASKDQGDHLTRLVKELQLPSPLVIQLDLPDETVRKRLKTRNRDEVEQGLKDYHRELDFAREYFPGAIIHTLDATQKPAAIAKLIRKLLGR